MVRDAFFAVSAPGLEGLVAQELRGMGIIPKVAKPTGGHAPAPTGEETGGVAFEGSLEHLYRANLNLRVASRVLVRLGEFHTAAFPELQRKTAQLPWERYLTRGTPVTLHVTCHQSRLYHSGAVAERVLAAIGERLGGTTTEVKGEAARNLPPDMIPPQLVVVRIANDECTISIDSSGALLHRRGYRQATAKAPLRENLAAAMLLAAGWDRASPLIDPFCGSGTIAIEAALMALGLPPGRNRRFAFMRWPGYRSEQWQAMLDAIQLRADCAPIQASDRDAGAVKIAKENAARARVDQAIQWATQAVSALQPPAGLGWVVTNPPYGLRVSEGKDLRNLYAQIGNVLRQQCLGWEVAILCSDLRLLGQTGLRLDTSFSMVNGGVSVRLGRGKVE